MRLIVDPEIQRLLPGQTSEENEAMKKSIKEHGCLNPVIAWAQNKNVATVLDGHHRIPFCRDNKIPFETKYVVLPDMSSARQWVIDHQLGKRNLNPTQASYYRGLDYLNNKESHGGDRKNNGDLVVGESTNGSRGKSCPLIGIGENTDDEESRKTAEIIGEKHGVSARTIKNDAAFAEAVNAISEAEGEEAKVAILSGLVEMTKKEIIEASKKPRKQKPKILCDSCKSEGAKKKCPTCKTLRERNKKSKHSDASSGASTDFTSSDLPDDPVDKTIDEVIKEKNHEIESFCRQLMKFVEEKMPTDEWLDDMNKRNGALQKFKDGCSTLRTAKCHGPCPVCNGQSCDKCKNTGRVPKYNHDILVK